MVYRSPQLTFTGAPQAKPAQRDCANSNHVMEVRHWLAATWAATRVRDGHSWNALARELIWSWRRAFPRYVRAHVPHSEAGRLSGLPLRNGRHRCSVKAKIGAIRAFDDGPKYESDLRPWSNLTGLVW